MDNLEVTTIEETPKGKYVSYTYTRTYGDEERVFEALGFIPDPEIKEEEVQQAIEDKLTSEIGEE